MKQLITLRPLEPYFFGGDRSFAYGNVEVQRAGGYYVRSLDAPSQTTLFGTLRFLSIESPNPSFQLSKKDKEWGGPKSYNIMSPEQILYFGKAGLKSIETQKTQ